MPDKKALDDLFRYGTRIGSLKQTLTNSLYGLNYSGVRPPIPDNKEDVGLIFITRPQLNLSTANIRNIRELYSLLTTDEKTVQRYVRCMLDPRLSRGLNADPNKFESGVTGTRTDPTGELAVETLSSPMVDEQQAFIPVLTNSITAASGWPDIVAPTFTSKQGLKKQQYSQIDGTIDIFESYDVDLSFRNQINDPIVYMMFVWISYASNLFEGKLIRYLDYIFSGTIDYNTRIYRLVLDKNRDRITKAFCSGVSFPMTVPTSQFFDYSDHTDYTTKTKEFSIRFRCLGAQFNDDIVLNEFNKAVGIFHPGLRAVNKAEDELNRNTSAVYKETGYSEDITAGSGMAKVPKDLRQYANFRMYPRINIVTYELEWWANADYVDGLKRIIGTVF